MERRNIYSELDPIFFNTHIEDLPLSINRIKSTEKQLTANNLPNCTVKNLKNVLLHNKVFDPKTKRLLELGINALYMQLIRQREAHLKDNFSEFLFAADYEEKLILVEEQLPEIKEFLFYKMDVAKGESMIFLPTESSYTMSGKIWPNDEITNIHIRKRLICYGLLDALKQRDYERAYTGILLHPGKQR